MCDGGLQFQGAGLLLECSCGDITVSAQSITLRGQVPKHDGIGFANRYSL